MWVKSATFEFEKGANMEKVDQLQAMEKDLIGMAREMEKLRAEVMNAEMRVHGNIFFLYTGIVGLISLLCCFFYPAFTFLFTI